MKADEFKAGDEVYCIFYGKGECIKIEEDDRIFPVTIKFETGRILNYTKDGRCLIDGNKKNVSISPAKKRIY